jgi:hypothetical protein
MLTPSDPAEVTMVRSERCGANGAIEFTDVIPGSYYVVAFDYSDTRGVPATAIPGSIIPIATGVRVESGTTASVGLRLSRWPW